MESMSILGKSNQGHVYVTAYVIFLILSNVYCIQTSNLLNKHLICK